MTGQPGSRGANDQQAAAIAARGEVFVSAGAGTGKTTVLVERFVRAVCDEGLDVESLLVITYTERAAGELRSRIRARLNELGRHDLARSLDGAWISTIHGFCLRLLKSLFRTIDYSELLADNRVHIAVGADPQRGVVGVVERQIRIDCRVTSVR